MKENSFKKGYFPMNRTSPRTFPLALNSVLFLAGIGFILIRRPVLCVVCFFVTSLLFIWTSKPYSDNPDSDSDDPLDETDSLHIELSLKIQELSDSNKRLSEENRLLADELNQCKAAQPPRYNPFYSCALTSALPVNLNVFFTDYLKSHADIMENHRLCPEYDCSVPDADTYLSSAALTVICDNILDNLLKFSPAPSTVYIRITAVEGGSLIIFKNKGDGPQDNEMEMIFDLNYQGVNQKSGTGLGLAQVKALVEDFGGHVQAKSPKGSGFALYIQLPERSLV